MGLIYAKRKKPSIMSTSIWFGEAGSVKDFIAFERVDLSALFISQVLWRKKGGAGDRGNDEQYS